MLGWPLGDSRLQTGAAIMLNILGEAAGEEGMRLAHQTMARAYKVRIRHLTYSLSWTHSGAAREETRKLRARICSSRQMLGEGAMRCEHQARPVRAPTKSASA